MTFTIDSTVLDGETIVVFEDLYRNGIKVGAHADITDKEQSIDYPGVKTTAMDRETEDNQGHTAKKVTIIDKVKYEKLIPGKEYTIKGILMDKETNAPLVIKDEQFMSGVTFTPEKSSGTVDMTFEVDSTALEGTTVVFEDLYHNGVKVTSHADLTDKDQSITYPKKPTVPNTGDHTKLLIWILLGLGAAGAAGAVFLRELGKYSEDVNPSGEEGTSEKNEDGQE